MKTKPKISVALWISWSVKRSKLLALIAFLVLGSSLGANLSSILLAADSLFSSGEFELAITEYKRYLCYETQDAVNPQTWKNLAMCLREIGESSKALQAIESAISLASDAEQRAGFTLDKALILMTSGNLSHAELILIRLTLRPDAPEITNLARWWLAVNRILQGKWTEASSVFSELAQSLGLTEEEKTRETIELFAAFAKKQPKNPKKAKLLSTILPGTGQLYGKDTKNAFNSFLVNAGFALYLTSSVLKHDFSGALPIALLGWRYYQGGRQNAEQGVVLFNAKQRKNQSEQALQALESFLDKLEVQDKLLSPLQ